MSLGNEAKSAVAKFVARFTFDNELGKAHQAELAEHIEAVISDFKATDMQPLIVSTIRRALQQRVVEAIESWDRGLDYYPRAVKSDDAA
jgi:hypothetical protein